jgi:hypothetical protein
MFLAFRILGSAAVFAAIFSTAWAAQPTAAELGIVPAKEITVGGTTIRPADPPKGLKTHAEMGIITAACMSVGRIHARPLSEGCYIETPRGVKTPQGDYLVMFPAGKGHFGWSAGKTNQMVAYRSHDQGRTWTGPTVPWDVPYGVHGFVPFIPRGGTRLYAFGTEPVPGQREPGLENSPIGFRYSDDDGHTWSPPTLIRPVNDPGYVGVSVMRMCQTDRGAWLLGTHTGYFKPKEQAWRTRQYVLRSEDHGATWTLLPDKRPGGWYQPQFDRFDEGRVISLAGGEVLLMMRSAEGHLWETRSQDDGRTWSKPRATPLVHPDAPPILFYLADGRTLIAFHHNRYDPKHPHFNLIDRSELWCSLSQDGGRTWSEPRFVLANASEPGPGFGQREIKSWSVSYDDLLVDGEDLHLFVDFQTRQVLHVHFRQADLAGLPTRRTLAGP